MSKHENRIASGTITHVFGHRFVLATETGDILADITPKGSEQIALRVKDVVTVAAEMKPSELKVTTLTRGKEEIRIAHKKKPHEDPHELADPTIARTAAQEAGFAIVGVSRRKPAHFELIGGKNGAFHELHITLNGTVRKAIMHFTGTVTKQDYLPIRSA